MPSTNLCFDTVFTLILQLIYLSFPVFFCQNLYTDLGMIFSTFSSWSYRFDQILTVKIIEAPPKFCVVKQLLKVNSNGADFIIIIRLNTRDVIENVKLISKTVLTLPWNLSFLKVTRYRLFILKECDKAFLEKNCPIKEVGEKRIVRRRWFTMFDDVTKDLYIQARACI